MNNKEEKENKNSNSLSILLRLRQVPNEQCYSNASKREKRKRALTPLQFVKKKKKKAKFESIIKPKIKEGKISPNALVGSYSS